MASTRRAYREVVGTSVGAAVDAFLSTLDNAGTARNYAGTRRALVIQLGADTPLAVLASPPAGAEVCSWFERRWGERAAAIWSHYRGSAPQSKWTNTFPARAARPGLASPSRARSWAIQS